MPFKFEMPAGRFDFDGEPFLAASRGRLGVRVQDLSEELAGYFGVKSGVLVAGVEADAPAAKAGIKAGDVITAVNGQAITEPGELRREVAKVEDGKTADLVGHARQEAADAEGRSHGTRPGRRAQDAPLAVGLFDGACRAVDLATAWPACAPRRLRGRRDWRLGQIGEAAGGALPRVAGRRRDPGGAGPHHDLRTIDVGGPRVHREQAGQLRGEDPRQRQRRRLPIVARRQLDRHHPRRPRRPSRSARPARRAPRWCRGPSAPRRG